MKPAIYVLCDRCGIERPRSEFYRYQDGRQRVKQPCRVCASYLHRLNNPAWRAAEDLRQVIDQWIRREHVRTNNEGAGVQEQPAAQSTTNAPAVKHEWPFPRNVGRARS